MNRPTVLIVEDEPSLRVLIRRVLEAADYGVREACNGAEALDQCQLHRIDVIITDVRMPHYDGVSLVRHLAARSSARLFLVMSAHAAPAELPAAAVFLPKPFTREELLAHVRLLLPCEAVA